VELRAALIGDAEAIEARVLAQQAADRPRLVFIRTVVAHVPRLAALGDDVLNLIYSFVDVKTVALWRSSRA
jgi:hypothetical protein